MSDVRRHRHDDERPTFDELEDALGGIFATARMAWSLNNLERALQHEEWTRALDQLQTVAERLEGEAAGAAAWRELLRAAIWLGPNVRNWTPIVDMVERYAQNAWSDESPEQMPWPTAMAFSNLDDASRLEPDSGAVETALALAHTLCNSFPRCALGHYARGHFDQEATRSRDAFMRAARLFDDHGADPAWARMATHARLRAGAAAMLGEADARRGRQALKSLRSELEHDADRLWWALAMSRSQKWLDRVRASDTVVDLYAGRTRDEEEFPEDLGQAVIWMVDQAPMRLQPTELDRLEALIEEGLPDEAAEHMLSDLRQRGAVADLLARPVGEIRDALGLAHGTDGEPRDSYYEALATLEDLEMYGKPDTDAFRDQWPVAADSVDILVSIRLDRPQGVATCSGLLEKRLREQVPSPAQLKPLGLLWPEALAYLRTLSQADRAEPTTVSRIRASLSDVGQRALTTSPSPSYGWWALAAHFLTCEMSRCAAIAAERAIRVGEVMEDSLESAVLTSVIEHIIESDGDDETLIWWLEVGEARLA